MGAHNFNIPLTIESVPGSQPAEMTATLPWASIAPIKFTVTAEHTIIWGTETRNTILTSLTGTAATEEQEFRDIYGMDVVTIPTNRPVQRIDHEDAVYKTKAEKYKAVVEAVKEAHEKGQPVLVGTVTIEVSELLSRMLSKEGIKHNVLNAKFHEQEAEIVADAGIHGDRKSVV